MDRLELQSEQEGLEMSLDIIRAMVDAGVAFECTYMPHVDNTSGIMFRFHADKEAVAGIMDKWHDRKGVEGVCQKNAQAGSC